MEKRAYTIVNKFLRKSEPQVTQIEPPVYGPKTMEEQFPVTAVSVRPLVKFLKDDVTVNDILVDRSFQEHVDTILQQQDTSDHRLSTSFPFVHIPNIHEFRGQRHVRKKTFMLADDKKNIYSFPPVLEEQAVPLPRQLERIPIKGGSIKNYDYNEQLWKESDTGTTTNHAEAVYRADVRAAKWKLRKKSYRLWHLGEKAESEKSQRGTHEEARIARDLEERMFQLNIGGEEVNIVTQEQNDHGILSQFLDNLGHQARRVISIKPHRYHSLKEFTALAGSTENYSGSEGAVVEDVTTTLPDIITDEALAHPDAYYLGCFASSRTNIRLIAVPAHPSEEQSSVYTYPSDSAYSVSARRHGEEQFTLSSGVHNFNAVIAQISVRNHEALPMEDGLYVVFAHQEPSTSDDPPEEVRIIGVSKSNQTLFYRDVDVTKSGPPLLPKFY